MAYALAFNPDNRRLAVSYATRTIASIYDSALGSHLADLQIGAMNDPFLAWHPDGARLALAGSDPRIQIWDVARPRELATLEGHAERVINLSFHPDGGLLASTAWDGVLRLWDSATGRQLMQLPLSTMAQFSKTGQLGYLWDGGEYGQSLEVTQSSEYRTIVSGMAPAGPTTLAISVPMAVSWRWEWAKRATVSGTYPAGASLPSCRRIATLFIFDPGIANCLLAALADFVAGRSR